MELKRNFRKVTELGVAFAAISALILAGCGGGGSSSGGTNNNPVNGTAACSSTSLCGVAAAGAPISQGIGYALDAVTGTKIPFAGATSSTGTYSVDLTTHTGPFLIHVRGITSGGAPVDLYSMATTANLGKTVNITPLTDVVVGYAAGLSTSSLETLCTSNLAACPSLFNGIVASLAVSVSNIMQALPASVLNAFSLSSTTFNPFSTTFTANHTGADALLDALQFVPPAASGASYAINLNGATVIPLVTVPISAQKTATAPTTNATPPTASAVVQAGNLATALAEVQAATATFSQHFATALPAAGSISPTLDPTFLLNGWNGAAFDAAVSSGNALSVGTQIIAGSLAPHAGGDYTGAAPAASVTYDANNCVTSLWSYFGAHGQITDTWKYIKTITNPTGCVGTWKPAGNQRARYAEFTPLFTKNQGATSDSFTLGFQLDTSASQTTVNTGQNPANPAPAVPYASVTITGPGLTTAGTPTATNGTVTLVPPTLAVFNAGWNQNHINDPYYSGGVGSDVLEDCALVVPQIGARATAATPCYNSNAVAGSDLVIKYYDAANTLLETTMQTLMVTLQVASVPTTWYPTITGVTPAAASSVPTGNSNVTYTYSLPTGAQVEWGGVTLYDAVGALLFSLEHPATSATSNTVAVTGLATVPTSGILGIIAPIGGLKVTAQKGF